MQPGKLQDGIVESIYSPTLTDVSGDIAEVVLDSFMDDGILKDLPVIGIIVKIFKGAMDIHDRLFVAKVARFLFRLSTVPLEQRRLFEEKINADPKLKHRIGLTLTLLLDRLDDIEKPDFVAWCFRAYLSGTITFDDFRRMASAIDNAFLDDLKTICKEDFSEIIGEGEHLSNLMGTGLITFTGNSPQDTWGEIGSIRYSLSPLGEQFVKIVRDANR